MPTARFGRTHHQQRLPGRLHEAVRPRLRAHRPRPGPGRLLRAGPAPAGREHARLGRDRSRPPRPRGAAGPRQRLRGPLPAGRGRHGRADRLHADPRAQRARRGGRPPLRDLRQRPDAEPLPARRLQPQHGRRGERGCGLGGGRQGAACAAVHHLRRGQPALGDAGPGHRSRRPAGRRPGQPRRRPAGERGGRQRRRRPDGLHRLGRRHRQLADGQRTRARRRRVGRRVVADGARAGRRQERQQRPQRRRAGRRDAQPGRLRPRCTAAGPHGRDRARRGVDHRRLHRAGAARRRRAGRLDRHHGRRPHDRRHRGDGHRQRASTDADGAGRRDRELPGDALRGRRRQPAARLEHAAQQRPVARGHLAVGPDLRHARPVSTSSARRAQGRSRSTATRTATVSPTVRPSPAAPSAAARSGSPSPCRPTVATPWSPSWSPPWGAARRYGCPTSCATPSTRP